MKIHSVPLSISRLRHTIGVATVGQGALSGRPLRHCKFKLTTLRRRYSHDNQNTRGTERPTVFIGHAPIPPGTKRESLTPRTKWSLGLAGPIFAACLFYWYNTEIVPVSGRKRFNCMSSSMVNAIGTMQYDALMAELQQQGVGFLPERDPRSQMSMRVMRQLVKTSGQENQRWDISIIDAPNIPNAMVLPGGKVIIFSGIFRFCRNDSSLAAVLGHEVAHNLAGHQAERLSGNIGFNLLLVSSLVALSWAAPFVMYYVGKPLLQYLVDLPMGRSQELEADYIGLMMMAEACYDPREAHTFWRRMESLKQQEPPEILSTHPSHASRVKKIDEWMPAALEKREQSQCSGTSNFADMLRRAFEQGYIIVSD